MAANYWVSTQYRNWLFTRDKLCDIREALERNDKNTVQQLSLPDRRHLSHWFRYNLEYFSKKMNPRQQALATAQLYIRRFYTKVDIRETNPYLVLVTALYLACKMEECSQHIRVVVSQAREKWPGYITSDVSKVGECEFFLISEMNCQLIVHHPYRTLDSLKDKLHFSDDEAQLAWRVINDHYLTDLPLLYPPHLIAVTAMLLALVLKPTPDGPPVTANFTSTLTHAFQSADQSPLDSSASSTTQGKVKFFVKWLAEGEVDIKAMIECTQEIISLYEVLERYDEAKVKESMQQIVKANRADR
ncbi:hypothetical protein MMC13_005460 [Lambiella insularis]|nr:hypothetical protein [Lambiella insularis]